MFCCDQHRFGHREHPPTSQRKATQLFRQLFNDYVIIFELILQNASIFKPHKRANRFRGSSGLGTHVSLVPFVVLFNIFDAQSLHLLVCQLNADGFFCFACGNKNYKLFTKSWNVMTGAVTGALEDTDSSSCITSSSAGSASNKFLTSTISHIYCIFFFQFKTTRSRPHSLGKASRS